MDKLQAVVGSGLLLASGVAAAHPGGFPHHFFSDPNTEHFWLIGSGLEYVVACGVATVVFFAVKRIVVRRK